MAAPVSPRFRRNREKPAVKTVEAHGKIRRRRVSRSESLESRPTKKISPELALAVKHDLIAGHHELPLEERIKAIVIGNSRAIPGRLAEKDMKNLCSSVEIQDWICKSFVEKNLVKGDKSAKGGNCDSGESSEDNPSRRANQNPQMTQSDVDCKRQSSQSQYDHGLSTLVPRSRSVHIRKSDQSSQDKTIAQTHASSCQRNTTEPSGLNSNTSDKGVTMKQKQSKSESVQEVGSSNITDAEKLMYKLRSSSIVRHKSLYSPSCNVTMLLPHPQSERGRSDDFLVRSPRSKSESRTLSRNSQASNFKLAEDRRENAGYQSAREMSKTSTTADTREASVSEKPKSPRSSRIVRKGSSLSRNRTDLFRAAKEHPGSISSIPSDYDYYLRTPSRGEKQSAKDIQPAPYRGAESQRDDKPSHSRTPSKEEKVSGEARRKTSQTSTESGSGGHLILRQCLIGTNLAFGLVQLNTGPNGNSHTDGHGLVTIRMRPDDQGRFGFNVKGGADQGMPIIVSRVAPGTPADIAIPRLNEGDQVLFINGRDVSQHTHEQVVMFIRASRETHSGELVLIVRPNVYVGEEAQEEPNLEYLPDNYQIIAPQGTGTNALEASLMLLQESLDSGAALAQFEQLYRKKPGMTMNAARLDDNIAKNRYRDISPYDQTRVILKEQNTSGGDYINANYVNMEIPGSGIVNRYIAAQGPLPKTCTDFWQMVWEQHSSLVVMLTTKVEKGRVKCHQYWPEMYETMDYGLLQITCVKEEETPSFAFREFNLTHVETSEERHISHMQYIAWPDHNVPDDPADFLEFVLKVRQRRMGMVEPTIVHCSAGIGRTGVLITMETAMCLIEANQPVYPLSIVRQMRDQRAMLIQTATQYKFVCEAILKVFSEELVKPLEDYSR
uniref:Tyrosine-protein phosphatase non-receptor type 4 n=1 Tax=Magallana gigas TaxID=29159 RepID=K1R6C8_MAGGI